MYKIISFYLSGIFIGSIAAISYQYLIKPDPLDSIKKPPASEAYKYGQKDLRFEDFKTKYYPKPENTSLNKEIKNFYHNDVELYIKYQNYLKNLNEHDLVFISTK